MVELTTTLRRPNAGIASAEASRLYAVLGRSCDLLEPTLAI